MPIASTAPNPGIANPWGTYVILPTDHGIKFHVGVRDPRNNILLAVLIGISITLALLTSHGFWSFLILLIVLLVLDAGLYFCLATTTLIAIEIRPDGLVVWSRINDDKSARFFDRRSITNQQLDFDGGLKFRYGIHDIRVTPGFANAREFEIFEQHLQVAQARLWHQENLD